MLKKIAVCIILMAMSLQVQASAFDSLEMQKLQEQSIELLRQQADQDRITMQGDVHPGEKLSDIFRAIDAYYDELFDAINFGIGLDELTSPIQGVETKCAIHSKKVAICELIITYRPLGETYIEFIVNLDSSQKAVSVKPIVDVSRGD